MTQNVLNTVGLSLNILGVIIIFIWGPPQPYLEEEVGMILEDNTLIDDSGKTAKDYNDKVKLMKKFFKRNSSIGLILILIGFLIQVIAIWIH
jgi:hypothetical protein